MRILQIVNTLQYGGLEKLVIELSAQLNSGQHESRVCCLEGPGPLQVEAERRRVAVHSLGKRPGVNLMVIPRLASLLRRERIDVVHTHNMGPLLYGSLAARLAGVRVVINTRHGREWKQRPAFLWAMNHAVVAISEDAKRRLLASNDVPRERVQVIYNGIDIHTFVPSSHGAIRTREGIAEQDLVIGTVARLAVEKDQSTLLRAFAKVCTVWNNAVLLVIGDGELRSSLEHLANELAIRDRVKFLGFRQDVADLVKALDLFVLSSVTEGISLTLLEAMAAGKPVVATAVGGNPEVIQDGVTGFLVPPKDPDALASAITCLLAGNGLMSRMGSAGRRRIEAQFTLHRMAEAYETLYERISTRRSHHR